MLIKHHRLELETAPGIAIFNITPQITDLLIETGLKNGQVLIASQHTTTALTINENEERLLEDIKVHFQKLIPADQPYLHNDLHLRIVPPDEPKNAHSHYRGAGGQGSRGAGGAGGQGGQGRQGRQGRNEEYNSIAYCLLPLAYCLLPLAYCLLPIASYLLPLTYTLHPTPYTLILYLNPSPKSDIIGNFFRRIFGGGIIPSGIFIYLTIDNNIVVTGNPFPATGSVSGTILKIILINSIGGKIIISFHHFTLITFR